VRRRLYWLAVLLSAALLAGGVVIGALGYAKTGGPDGAVRGYFAALARSDASGALGYGNVPAGPHTLLTGAVLREQQRIAPLRHFAVVSTERRGPKATVQVRYTLAFAGRNVPMDVSVPVHQSGGEWRLDQAAIPTQLLAANAGQRETIVGAAIPEGTTLVFPGALPVRTDTPYLELNPTQDQVAFGANPTTSIVLQVSAAGRTALLAVVRSKLAACLTGKVEYTCPLPDERYVPGSIRGKIKGALRVNGIDLDATDPAGKLNFDAAVTITGTYRRLDFHNRQVAGHGDVVLTIDATSYAVPPLTIMWAKP
jgi:hypothetical protein